MTTQQQVLSFEPTSSKPGAWLKMKVVDDKGEQRDAYLKPADLIALVKQPGMYEFTKEKNGKYWEITGVKFVRPLGAAASTPTNGNGQHAATTTSKVAGQIDANVLVQNKAITAQVCVKAAAELFGKAVEAGAFKVDNVVDTDSMTSCAAALARKFMDECRAFVTAKSEEKKEEKQTYTDDQGRVHEVLPEGA